MKLIWLQLREITQRWKMPATRMGRCQSSIRCRIRRSVRGQSLIKPARHTEFLTVPLRPLITAAAAGVLLNELRAHALMLSDLPHVDRSPDPADNFLLAMAQAGEADALVTGDKHDLLILGTFQRTRIITAQQFLTQLGDKTKRPPKRKVAASRRKKRKTSR